MNLARLALGAGIALLAILYELPFAVTAYLTGPRSLPPNFAPDLYFYLAMGNIKAGDAGTVINPWYGIAAQIPDVIYYRFGLVFRLLVAAQHALGSSYAQSILVWVLVINLGIAIACFKFFRHVFPDGSAAELFAATALVMLVEITDLRNALSLPNLLSGGPISYINLPYIRIFFPQIPVLVLFLYLIAQIKALQSNRIVFWLGMALLQFLVLITWPYALPIMACSTALACLGSILMAGGQSKNAKALIISLVVFGGVSAVLDLMFMATAGSPTHGLLQAAVPLWHPQLTEFRFYVGFAIILLAALTLFEFVYGLRTRSVGLVSLAGCGVAVTLLHFSNLIIDPAFPFSSHFDYLVTTMLTSLLGCLVVQLALFLRPRFRSIKWAAVALCALLLVYGVLASIGLVQNFLSYNTWQAAVEHALEGMDLQETDLVVTPAETVDQPDQWVPLIANTHVLFSLNAESALDAATRDQTQRERLALYLYLTGKDSQWVEAVIAPSNPAAKGLNILVNITQRGTLGSPDPQPVFDEIRAQLVPRLARLEANPALVTEFFKAYQRVVFVDNATAPTFSPSVIERHFDIVDQRTANQVQITTTIPKQN